MPAPKGNKYAQGNKGGGSKTRFKQEYCELAYNYCLLGATDENLGSFFGVSEKTICEWKKRHKEFASALKRGKEDADANVAKSLYNRALGYSHPEEKIFQSEGQVIRAETVKHYPPDATAMIFWLKNRQPELWREKQHQEHSGPNGGPIQHKHDVAKELFDEIAQRGQRGLPGAPEKESTE